MWLIKERPAGVWHRLTLLCHAPLLWLVATSRGMTPFDKSMTPFDRITSCDFYNCYNLLVQVVPCMRYDCNKNCYDVTLLHACKVFPKVRGFYVTIRHYWNLSYFFLIFTVSQQCLYSTATLSTQVTNKHTIQLMFQKIVIIKYIVIIKSPFVNMWRH